VTAGWVAGSVRARAIARRRIGKDEARRLAGCGSLGEALDLLAATPYRTRSAQAAAGSGGPALAAAQHAVLSSVLWDLRVLAGWLPQGGTTLMRILAGWYEIANADERIAELSGRDTGATFTLGALATAWPALRRSASLGQMRAALSASAWQDPGGDSEQAVQVGMRARWAQRVAGLGEPARTWAASALVLLLAAERFGAGRAEHPVLGSVAAGLAGPAAADAGSLGDLAARLPRRLHWVLDGVHAPGDLWRAEAAWWARTEQDGMRLLDGPGFDRRPVIGAAVVLAADARRVAAALEIAARGGGAAGAFDAVA